MKNYASIMTRALNRPLLLEPGYARVFFSALAGRFDIKQLSDADGEVLTGEKMRMSAESFSPSRDRNRPYRVENGVAVLPISGTLVHKSGNIQPYSGTTGYDGIIHRAADAFANPDIKGVLMDNDTPGGEVAGCFDTSQRLREMADKSGKQLWSLCYDMNCSAGMALASSAHRRLITQTGVAGSVGVLMAHSSYEGALKENGLKVTLIHSGKYKVDGNPYEDLPEEVLARFQEKTDALRLQFCEIIATHMNLSVEDVLATEAAVFQGQEAIDVGFADQLVNGHEAISVFSEYLSSQGRATIAIGASMTQEKKPDASAEGTKTVVAAGPDLTEPTANTEAIEKARADERERCKTILTHAESEGRTKLAHHLAFGTDMSSEDAITTLAASSQENAAHLDSGTALDKAMAGTDQPQIGADSEQSEDDQPDQVAEMLAAHKLMTGAK